LTKVERRECMMMSGDEWCALRSDEKCEGGMFDKSRDGRVYDDLRSVVSGVF
jgi:hypothetical protein